MIKHRHPISLLLAFGVLTEAKRKELADIYQRLNPVLLLKQINDLLEQLWQLARHPVNAGNTNMQHQGLR